MQVQIAAPGMQGIGHQWAYLPDVAETLCRLVAREEELGDFATFHMDGHWDADGTQMANAIRRVAQAEAGAKPVRIKAMPWWLMTAMAAFVPTLHEMKKMRYLWKQSLRLRNDKLLALLGTEPHTPLDVAVRTTLQGLGCMAVTASGVPVPATC